ncbi:MAG: urea transporter [Candidatus Rokubacteria bacterium]|nr:urea transporter [Candidatus Rokubacteria bacterium]
MTVRVWLEALLAGIAQTLLSNKPATGVALLAAGALVAPLHTLTALVGVAAATGTAAWARWNRPLLRSGLFGFNGAVVGLVWPELFDPTSPGFWLLVPAAVAATALQGRLLPPFSCRNLPVLGLPFLLVTWSVGVAGTVMGWRKAVTGPLPHLGGPVAGWNDPALLAQIGETVTGTLPGLALVATAAALTSWALLGAALLGAGAGLAVTVALGGADGLLWIGAVLYNAVPAAIAVACVFSPFRPWSLAAGAVSAGLAAAVWALITPSLASVGVFPLTLPMHIVLLAGLVVSRRGLTAPLGLAATITAEPSRTAVQALSGLLRRASRIVVLSGAGMSTESGIPDYRSQLGFWFDANAADLVYQRFLASVESRRLYWRLQRRFMGVLDQSAPNAGHRALARLDASGRLLGIITQNVDGLHQAAGCRPDGVVELHGSARWVVCLACGHRTRYAEIARRINGVAPPCDRCGGLLKTETVSFGEPLVPARLAQAIGWAREADLLLILGTSLQVEPAARLPEIARSHGAPLVVVNRTPTPWDAQATLVVQANVGTALSAALSDADGPRIRRITRSDYGFLCQVADLWWGDAVRYLLHPVYIDHFSETSLVLEDERGIAGFLLGFISPSHPEEGYVHMVATAPDRRGQGIGRALYEAFCGLAGERGCRRVVAITVPYNTGSLAFHRRLGFTFRESGAVWEGDVPVVLDHAGPGVHCVVMERRI